MTIKHRSPAALRTGAPGIPTPTRPAIDDQLVDVKRFVELATSRKNMVRSDDAINDRRGLLDTVTGVRYMIDSYRLTA